MSNSTPPGEDFLTTAQVAELSGWSVTSINRWAGSGVLPARKLPGRTGAWLFDRTDIDKYLEARGTAA